MCFSKAASEVTLAMCGVLAHINLARDGGGDEGGAAFLQQVDGALGLVGGECGAGRHLG